MVGKSPAMHIIGRSQSKLKSCVYMIATIKLKVSSVSEIMTNMAVR